MEDTLEGKKDVTGRNILVIDDIMSTGSTIFEIAKTL